MNKKKKCHIRQMVCTVLGIVLVLVLFGAAMIFPGYYSQIYDQNMLNRVSFTDVNVSTYEASYNSFVSKLHAIAKACYGGGVLRAVRTNELEGTVDRTDLTRTVNEELLKLYELKLLAKKMKPKERRLTQCERYTIYETNETEGMKGISIWKMVYENSQRKITIFWDEEYHKIFYLEIYFNQSSVVTDVTEPISSQNTAYKKEPGNIYSVNEDGWRVIDYCWPLFMEYYDVDSYKEGVCHGWIQEEGECVLEFDEQYRIPFIGIIDTGVDFQRCRMGIPLEKMIQF